MKKSLSRLYLTICVLASIVASCSTLAPAPTPTSTSTPALTNTPLPTFTITPMPTDTPSPTATPNVEATQKAEEFQSILEKFKKKGYISTTEGESLSIEDFKGEFAQINHYYKWWWPVKEEEYSNFVFSARFRWGSYVSAPDVSGCGIGFGIKENDDHYAVFLDRENLFLVRGKGARIYRMGVADGGRFSAIPLSAKANFAAAVWDQNVTVLVNGVFINYILSSDQDAKGKFAFSLLSGSNGGYGTRCEMTDIMMWTPK